MATGFLPWFFALGFFHEAMKQGLIFLNRDFDVIGLSYDWPNILS